MSWVAADTAERLRVNVGVFGSHDWCSFVSLVGLSVIRTADLPESLPAIIVGDTIAIHTEVPTEHIPLLIWHEIGHWALHVGDVRWWESRPQGRVTVAKMERQAWEFALLFPEWE